MLEREDADRIAEVLTRLTDEDFRHLSEWFETGANGSAKLDVLVQTLSRAAAGTPDDSTNYWRTWASSIKPKQRPEVAKSVAALLQVEAKRRKEQHRRAHREAKAHLTADDFSSASMTDLRLYREILVSSMKTRADRLRVLRSFGETMLQSGGIRDLRRTWKKLAELPDDAADRVVGEAIAAVEVIFEDKEARQASDGTTAASGIPRSRPIGNTGKTKRGSKQD